ncbi:MAG: hypothetical protein IT335_06285 [Thermomicrobiales bacterium]|nr:hypothetical protein [Thermomicrobiales bacterium]
MMSQYKSGPRKHPGGWHQFIYRRLHGLAAGDDLLSPNDPSLLVRVRRPTVEEAWTEVMHLMREASASLTPSAEHEHILAVHRQRLEFMESRMRIGLAEHLREREET